MPEPAETEVFDRAARLVGWDEARALAAAGLLASHRAQSPLTDVSLPTTEPVSEQDDAAILNRIVEPEELRDLPPEVIRLVHAVDRMRDHWAEAGPERQAELWRGVHQASDGVWGRFDDAWPSQDVAPAARPEHPDDCEACEHGVCDYGRDEAAQDALAASHRAPGDDSEDGVPGRCSGCGEDPGECSCPSSTGPSTDPRTDPAGTIRRDPDGRLWEALAEDPLPGMGWAWQHQSIASVGYRRDDEVTTWPVVARPVAALAARPEAHPEGK